MTNVWEAINTFDASDIGQGIVAANDAVLDGNALVVNHGNQFQPYVIPLRHDPGTPLTDVTVQVAGA